MHFVFQRCDTGLSCCPTKARHPDTARRFTSNSAAQVDHVQASQVASLTFLLFMRLKGHSKNKNQPPSNSRAITAIYTDTRFVLIQHLRLVISSCPESPPFLLFAYRLLQLCDVWLYPQLGTCVEQIAVLFLPV